jgi:hypothetical protein
MDGCGRPDFIAVRGAVGVFPISEKRPRIKALPGVPETPGSTFILWLLRLQ